MAYFPAAYRKVLVSTGGDSLTTPLESLGAGWFGLFDANTWQPIDIPNADATVHPKIIIGVSTPYYGGFQDKHGPYGGYSETLKSPVIEARHITRFWKVKPRSARQHIVALGWDGQDLYDATPVFYCGQIYRLRIDLKGDAALRFLGHNLYRTFSVSTGCCNQIDDPERIDPVAVTLQFAQQINEDPILSPFITALVRTEDWDTGDKITVDPATYVPFTDPDIVKFVPASLMLMVTYEETTFSDCSFDPVDHFEAEPLTIAAAQWVNEEGRVCPGFQTLTMTELQAPLAAEGTPERLLRDYILSNSYRQDLYSKDARMRLITGMNYVVAALKEFDKYITYYVLHTVPRRYNPSGIYDDDQYLTQISFRPGDSANKFEDWFEAYLTSAGTGVVLEDLSGVPDPT